MLDKTLNIDADGLEKLLGNGVLAKPITYDHVQDTNGVRAASALVPDGYRIEHLPWERSQARPFAKRADRSFNDTASFIDYVRKHAEPDATAVFVTPPGRAWNAFVEAVLDDHSKDEPGWGDHRATLHLPQSDQLAEWKRMDKSYVGQIEFSEFIEANLVDIVEPDAATLLEVVSSLQSTNKVSFDSAVRLDNGQVQVRYSEEVSATAGRQGTLEIPQEFKIAVPVFEFGTRYAIKARLRYRVRDQKLVLAYVLDRLDDIVRAALATGEDSVLGTLRKELSSGDDAPIPVYLGSAGSAPRWATLEAPVKDDE